MKNVLIDMKFKAQFYYKDEPAVNGLIEINAAHKDEASLKIYLMIKNNDEAVPGNWDRYELK